MKEFTQEENKLFNAMNSRPMGHLAKGCNRQ